MVLAMFLLLGLNNMELLFSHRPYKIDIPLEISRLLFLLFPDPLLSFLLFPPRFFSVFLHPTTAQSFQTFFSSFLPEWSHFFLILLALHIPCSTRMFHTLPPPNKRKYAPPKYCQ